MPDDAPAANFRDTPTGPTLPPYLLASSPPGDAPTLPGYLFDDEGRPKLADFGLARLDGGGPTRTGELLGTPAYMSPEQTEAKKDVGPPADVWALGVVMYELLTGVSPFLAATLSETLVRILSDEPVPLRRLQAGVPRDLETICLKCLRKEPAIGVGRIERSSFSADGSRVCAVPQVGTKLAVWDVVSQRRLAEIAYPDSRVYRVAFRPDGKEVAGAGEGGDIRLWDAETGREVGRLKGHAGRVRALAYSGDGGRLASGGEDATARVWDLANGGRARRIWSRCSRCRTNYSSRARRSTPTW